MSKLREEYENETGSQLYYWFQEYAGASMEKHGFDEVYVEWLEQKLQSHASQNDLEHLYEWLMNENREPAQTKFTSGMLRNIAKEIEFRLREEVLSDMMSKDEELGLYDVGDKERKRIYEEIEQAVPNALWVSKQLLKQLLKL